MGVRVLCTELWGRNMKRQIGRPRRRCEDNIKISLKAVRLEGVDWINVAQHRDA
jgi:hypothetical protein